MDSLSRNTVHLHNRTQTAEFSLWVAWGRTNFGHIRLNPAFPWNQATFLQTLFLAAFGYLVLSMAFNDCLIR